MKLPQPQRSLNGGTSSAPCSFRGDRPGNRLEQVCEQLAANAAKLPPAGAITPRLFLPAFPLDPQPNARRVGEKLATWAAKQ